MKLSFGIFLLSTAFSSSSYAAATAADPDSGNKAASLRGQRRLPNTNNFFGFYDANEVVLAEDFSTITFDGPLYQDAALVNVIDGCNYNIDCVFFGMPTPTTFNCQVEVTIGTCVVEFGGTVDLDDDTQTDIYDIGGVSGGPECDGLGSGTATNIGDFTATVGRLNLDFN